MAKVSTYIALSAVLAVSVAAEVVDSDAFAVLERDADCRSSCIARHGDDPPFTLSFDSYEKGYRTYINLRIEDREFRGLSTFATVYKETVGFLSTNTGSPDIPCMGLVSLASAKNMEVHYFIRFEDGLRYLGEFANLSYDTDSGMFVEFFVHGQANMPQGLTMYFRATALSGRKSFAV